MVQTRAYVSPNITHHIDIKIRFDKALRNVLCAMINYRISNERLLNGLDDLDENEDEDVDQSAMLQNQVTD